MRRLCFGLLALSACSVPLTGLPPALHPTGSAAQTSVGLAVGGVVAMDETDEGQDDNTQLVIPWGEGWARWGRGTGQFELHVLPALASLGYRFDLSAMGPGVGFALIPAVQTGLTYTWESSGDPFGEDNSGGILLLGASVTGTILIPSGSGFIYLAPRAAISTLRPLGDLDEGDSDSVELFTFGAVIGVDLGGGHGIGTSFELSVQRTSNLDSDENDEPIWLLVPTFGLRI
jgi:hypothetical protein